MLKKITTVKKGRKKAMLGFKKAASSKVKWKRTEFKKLRLIFIVIENEAPQRGKKKELSKSRLCQIIR